jgi:hypothetical protein
VIAIQRYLGENRPAWGSGHANTVHMLLRYEGCIGRIYYNKQKAAEGLAARIGPEMSRCQ